LVVRMVTSVWLLAVIGHRDVEEHIGGQFDFIRKVLVGGKIAVGGYESWRGGRRDGAVIREIAGGKIVEFDQIDRAGWGT